MPEFDPKVVEKQSMAARSLCMWCRAMDTYSIVAKEVAPKKARLAAMQEALAEANARLAEKEAELNAALDKAQAL